MQRHRGDTEGTQAEPGYWCLPWLSQGLSMKQIWFRPVSAQAQALRLCLCVQWSFLLCKTWQTVLISWGMWGRWIPQTVSVIQGPLPFPTLGTPIPLGVYNSRGGCYCPHRLGTKPNNLLKGLQWY